MRLLALSVGPGVPPDRFRGVVHSVFRRACNVRLDDGALLTLLTSEHGNVPGGIRVAAPARFSFEDSGARAGGEVRRQGGRLHLSGTGLSVDLAEALPWHHHLTEVRVDLHRPEAEGAWDVAYAALRAGAPECGLSALAWEAGPNEPGDNPSGGPLAKLPDTARPAMRRLALAVAEASPTGFCGAAESLIGLGPGLTPSGDDYLAGFMGGLWCTAAAGSGGRPFIAEAGAGLVRLAERTNDISRSYLHFAAQGFVSEPLLNLAKAIEQGSAPAAMRGATRTAMSVGHSSGADGVLGLLLGIRAGQVFRPIDANSQHPRAAMHKG